MDDVGVWVSKKLSRFVGPTEDMDNTPARKHGHEALQEAAE
jgi:hypothetical protein